jgi:putative oxidoreductase
MAKANYYLIAGGVISALISIFHVLLVLNPGLFSYISPDQESGLAQMGFMLLVIPTFILALIFAIWTLYAFSGAGLIRQLPRLRTALIVIGVIYILRALFLPFEINMVLIQGYPFRFVVFSSISLLAGLLYLLGVYKLRTSLNPNTVEG